MCPSNTRSLKVFLCYAHSDAAKVRDLYRILKNAGADAWLDKENLLPGSNWDNEIRKAIWEADVVIVCLSKQFDQDGYRQKEIQFALDAAMEKPEDTIFLIPARFEECENLYRLSRRHWVDLFHEDGLQKLWRALNRRADSIGANIKALDPDIIWNDVSPISYGVNAIQAETRKLRTDTQIPEPVKLFSSTQPAHQTSVEIKDRLTIIVPIYNESRIIKDLVRELKAENLIDRYTVILCDDGSTDNSFEVMKKYTRETENIICIQNRFNERKVGAIYNMAQMVQTKFILTLDADCVLSELTKDALESLIDKMDIEDIAATCFRITPNERGLLSKLQKLDYTIFTDSIRRIMGVPVCLIGQGVLWKTESLLTVLSHHSGVFDGDDLENTIIALQQGMNIYWENQTIILKTESKRTLLGLIKQRALSWDFGMFRVLFKKRALSLGGNAGAFYKNILLLDFFAHPLKIISIPLLFSVPIVNFMGLSFYDNGFSDIYREAIFTSFKFGSYGVIGIWLMTVVNVFFCVRGNLPSILKWSIFSAVYLSSPFVYILYYPLLNTPYINAYDVLGAAIHWLGTGLLFTYLWWVLLTYFLILASSLDRRDKYNLALVVFLSPLYYFLLLVLCRTIAIIKYLTTLLNRKLPL